MAEKTKVLLIGPSKSITDGAKASLRKFLHEKGRHGDFSVACLPLIDAKSRVALYKDRVPINSHHFVVLDSKLAREVEQLALENRLKARVHDAEAMKRAGGTDDWHEFFLEKIAKPQE